MTDEQKANAILTALPWRCRLQRSPPASHSRHDLMVPGSAIYDVFCLFDSMEGRALAAEERLKQDKLEERDSCMNGRMKKM